MNYILKGKEVVAEPDLMKWAKAFEKTDRVIKQEAIATGMSFETPMSATTVNLAEGKLEGCRISTVFLGIDHNLEGDGPPLLFETMVFGGKLDQEQDRYATYDEALAGHGAMKRRVLSA
jgi:hypothetical protein